MSLLKNVVFLWVVAGALALLAILGYCHKRGESAIPPKVQKELNDLRDTRERDSVVIDSLKQHARGATGKSDSLLTRGYSTLASANRVRQLADEAAFAARQALSARDSATKWHAAYEARSDEADSLRQVVAYLDSANTERERARQNIASALALSESRRQRSERLNEDLADVIKRQEKGCRFLFVKCPSRTVVGIVGVVVGAGGYAVLTAGR